jgi:hypothetical protein
MLDLPDEGGSSHIKALIFEYKGSVVLELQQRAIEFGSILSKHTDIKYISSLSCPVRVCHFLHIFFDCFAILVWYAGSHPCL